MVDYSEEPFPDRIIFDNPCFSSSTPSFTPPLAAGLDSLRPPVGLFPRHSIVPPNTGPIPIDPPIFEAPSLSPDALHFPPTRSPPAAIPQTSATTNTSSAGPCSSGGFKTSTDNVNPSKPSPLDGVTNPLVDNPTTPRTSKKKSKCIKVTSKDISIRLGEASAISDLAIMASTVLVGHIRGRAYSEKKLSHWVKEIWGDLLLELLDVHVLPRGWFSLQFSKESYTNLVLARYWHIESALVLLKRWSPLFDPVHEQIGAGPIWVRLPGLPLQF